MQLFFYRYYTVVIYQCHIRSKMRSEYLVLMSFDMCIHQLIYSDKMNTNHHFQEIQL
jgi:hypothetical protein